MKRLLFFAFLAGLICLGSSGENGCTGGNGGNGEAPSVSESETENRVVPPTISSIAVEKAQKEEISNKEPSTPPSGGVVIRVFIKAVSKGQDVVVGKDSKCQSNEDCPRNFSCINETCIGEGVFNPATCRSDAGNRFCSVEAVDPMRLHPCDDPMIGQCDTNNLGVCLIQPKGEGEPCNEGKGICNKDHQCIGPAGEIMTLPKINIADTSAKCGAVEACSKDFSCVGGECVRKGAPDPDTCKSDAGNRLCSVKGTTPHPCQEPDYGQCDTSNIGLCLFQWKMEGASCEKAGQMGSCNAYHECVSK